MAGVLSADRFERNAFAAFLALSSLCKSNFLAVEDALNVSCQQPRIRFFRVAERRARVHGHY